MVAVFVSGGDSSLLEMNIASIGVRKRDVCGEAAWQFDVEEIRGIARGQRQLRQRQVGAQADDAQVQ